MPKYLALFSYSPGAMAGMIDNPVDREAAVNRVVDSVGARLESMYWMFGSFDGMAVVEAPDSITMAGMSAAIASTGTVHSETHELFSSADVQKILTKAGEARANFTRPGDGS